MNSENWCFAHFVVNMPGISEREYIIRSSNLGDFASQLFSAMRQEHELVNDQYWELFESSDWSPILEDVAINQVGQVAEQELQDSSECEIAWRATLLKIEKLETAIKKEREADLDQIKGAVELYNLYHELGLASAEDAASLSVFFGNTRSFGEHFFKYLTDNGEPRRGEHRFSPLSYFSGSLRAMARLASSEGWPATDVQLGAFFSWLDLYDDLVEPS